MTNKQAIKEALKCMKEVSHKLSIDANLYEWYKCESSETTSAYKRREKIKEAMLIIEKLL